MSPLTVTTGGTASEPVMRPAAKLAVGDRIAAGFLPRSVAATVEFATAYRGARDRDRWTLVVYRYADGGADADHFLAKALIPLESAADDGMGFSDLADRLHGEDKAVPADADVHALGRAAQ